MLVASFLVAMTGCQEAKKADTDSVTLIELKGQTAVVDGKAVTITDYTWHCDPENLLEEEKKAPAVYHTGNKMKTDEAVYIDHDLVYFPILPEADFKEVLYNGEPVYAYYYQEPVYEDYIFGTLPKKGDAFPSHMMHTEEEAAANQVLHITKAGIYRLTGQWQGQILVDLGEEEDVIEDSNAQVQLILDGVDIHCSVAPAILIENVYECDPDWEDRTVSTPDIDLGKTGIRLILADDSDNRVTGTNVSRLLKTKYKKDKEKEGVRAQKKLARTDSALYARRSMTIEGQEKGNGQLTVESSFEGVDSELHMRINGGKLTILAQDDGINTNEEHVSIFEMKGGEVTIFAGLGAEGDGVDSNGYIKISGGSLFINGIRDPDHELDSDDGVYYTGGQVILDGEEKVMDKTQTPIYVDGERRR